MNFDRLEKDITENIREAQQKLGFEHRPLHLNYISSTLCHLLGGNFSGDELAEIFRNFAEFTAKRLGNITASPIRDGFCITIPAEGTEWVHTNTTGKEFVCALVETARQKHDDIDSFLEVFRSFSDTDNVAVLNPETEEFEYLVYFKNGVPNDYRYCINTELFPDGHCHITYHRFIPEDYEEMFG
ncbi:MAG: DUF3877 family protein [Ruminococcus sp.]|nr:DUF3877 family protein [Ruminococcus sp.]